MLSELLGLVLVAFVIAIAVRVWTWLGFGTLWDDLTIKQVIQSHILSATALLVGCVVISVATGYCLTILDWLGVIVL